MGMDESSRLQQPLPEAWIAKIFQELQGNYGTRFLNQWKTGQVLPDGTDAGIRNAMQTWARNLSGFRDTPAAFKSVLESLPSEPPSAPQFVEMCRDAARRIAPKLDAIEYKPTAEEQARADEAIKTVAKRITATDTRDHRAWARKLQERHEAGEVLATQAMDYARYL